MTQTPLNTVTSQIKTRHEFCSERPMFKRKQMYCSEVNEGELVEDAIVSPGFHPESKCRGVKISNWDALWENSGQLPLEESCSADNKKSLNSSRTQSLDSIMRTTVSWAHRFRLPRRAWKLEPQTQLKGGSVVTARWSCAWMCCSLLWLQLRQANLIRKRGLGREMGQ